MIISVPVAGQLSIAVLFIKYLGLVLFYLDFLHFLFYSQIIFIIIAYLHLIANYHMCLIKSQTIFNQISVIFICQCKYSSSIWDTYLQFKLYFKIIIIFYNLNLQISMSNQHEIKYMLGSLKLMQDKLGGPNSKRSLAGTQFDYIQQEFLSKRHQIQKWQDQKEREGLTTKNAEIAYKIRQGSKQLKQLLQKLQKQYERLVKKKKDPPHILQSKSKIVKNCEMLYQDIQDRLYGDSNPNSYNKPMTLTDMKAKLLNQIDVANDYIHKGGSQDKLSQINQQEIVAMQAFKKKDEEQDVVLDEIIQAVGNVRKKAQNINEKQDEINKKVEQNNRKAAKLENRIKTDNQKLKVIIEKFKPGRCCLAMFLLLLFIGLIVVIIKFLVPAN